MIIECKVKKLQETFLWWEHIDIEKVNEYVRHEITSEPPTIKHYVNDRQYSNLPNDDFYDEDCKRIAWFVLNGWDDPITIDFGCPSMGYFEQSMNDGNHRYHASILRNDRTIKVDPCGENEVFEKYI